MIKVKDGYGKLIGTTYKGSADHLLRSNGDTWAVHTGRNNEANKIVRTDSNGQLQVGWINTTSGNLGTANITRIYCSNDDYIRYKTPENFFSTLSNNGDNISITVASQNRTLVVGYSKVAGQLRSKGTISPQTGRTQSLGDVYSYHLNGSVSGGPTKYASVIGFGRGTSGTVEIAGEWTSGRGLWVRALRDTTDNWYAWDKVLTQATYTGITDSRYYTKTQADERFVNITGDTMTGELINSSANAYRLKQSNYGVILRNDNNSFWILLTNSGSPSGSYNSLRPFRINLPDGRVTIGNGLSVTGTIVGSSTIQGTQLISTIANGTAPLKVTSKTVVTNLNSDLLDGYHETSFFRARGSQTIASSIPTTTELSSNNNLSGNWNVTFPGASGHLVQFNTGSGRTRYMQFYSYYSGSLYWRNSTDSTLSTKSWKTIVDSANYTGIVLKIGTATKGSATLPIYLNAGTPTACSTTLGVSITGNAATATKLQTARTINGTSFNGTANITTAYWGATRTITLSGAVTGSASVNGSQNVTITTTYQTGSIDGRYVGGKKTAGHGSQGTAYTADTYSSNFVNKAFVAYAERGSWAYANNGYITTDTGVNIPLAGTAIFQWGASDTNKTQLFITPHNNSGVSNPATNEMLFYTSNGSGYTSAWTRVLTHRNYTTYTVTKTGGGASGTWGISITGNAATANRIISHSISDTLANKTTPGYLYHAGGSNSVKDKPSGVDAFGVFTMQTASGWYGQLLMSSNTSTGLYWRTATSLNGGWKKILDSSNYTAYVNPANFVTSLGTNGNYVTWTKNGTTNNLTVPFATTSNVLNNLGNRTAISGTTVGQSGLRLYKVYNNGYPVTCGNVLNIGGSGYGELLFQWTGDSNPGHLYYRSKRDTASQAWSNWVTILDNNNYSSTLDGRYVTLTTNQTVSGIKTFSRQQKFTVATGTSPFTVSSTTVVSNLNADMLDGWHLSYILKDGYVTSGTAGLSSYWRKVWDITLNSQYNDVDINLLVHSAYNQQWGIISFRLRQNGTGTAKNISAYLAEVVGNIPLDRFRLYYNNSSGLCQLWCNPSGQYNVYNYRVLAKTWRTGTEATTLGTFYTGNTTTAQSLPSGSYVSMTGITIVNTAAKVANTLTFSAGKFSSKTYNGSSAITVNVPTRTSHLTNDSGFLTGNVIRAVSANGYWGMARPDSNTSDWIRTTSSGIIPYQSGGRGAGHCGLGNSSWYFSSAYIDTVHGNLDGTATNADKLDGFHANTSQNPFGKIPTVTSSGVMEVGRYLDFHYNSSDTSDYRTRLQINHSSGSYTAILPAKSGTLAMTSDIPTVTNYYWANVRVSSSSSTGTSPTFSTAYTSNWFRSNGNTGWRSESYGGGWYMTDSTWIRTYGSKSVYQNTGQIRTDGYLVTNGGITIGATSPNNDTYKLYCNGQSYHRGDSYYTAAIRLNNRGNNSIYCGPNDAANTIGGALNNLVFSSWNGVSFTTSCSGQICTNKNAVSINCRTGQLNAYQVYANGFHHRFMDSNNYVLLAGGSYKNLADFAKGNAGSATQGVYVTGGTVKAMTYSLKATVNSGSSGKLAYYSGTNSIDDYTSTKGSSSTPIYLNAGVPTACSGVIVKYWGWYNINCYSSTTPLYSKKGGNFNFVTSISRRSEGKYTLGTVYPSGYTWNNTIYWGSGRLNKGMSSNSSNSVLYVTMFNGYQSGSTHYLYVNTADDSSTNDGYFDVFFLCF